MLGCSHQIWSGQVCSRCAKTLYPKGVWGHAPNTMLLGHQINMNEYLSFLPIVSYTTGVSFQIQFAYRQKATLFTGEACETNHSLVRRECCWRNL